MKYDKRSIVINRKRFKVTRRRSFIDRHAEFIWKINLRISLLR